MEKSFKCALHITVKTQFGQLKNLSSAAVSSQDAHILNPWWKPQNAQKSENQGTLTIEKTNAKKSFHDYSVYLSYDWKLDEVEDE